MSNENKTIHDFDFDMICDLFSHMNRQGPGSPEMTLKALSFIDDLPPAAEIADVGCGTGGQTMTLAGAVDGHITGIDLFPKFIEIFNRSAAQAGFSDRVKGVVGDMGDLSFDEGSLDLIWSEGAIYNIGFRRGLEYLNRFLKKGGWIAVSEATWFTAERPDEIHRFWHEAYPEIDTMDANVRHMQESGYVPVAAFALPENCWTDNFHRLMPPVWEKFLRQYPDNPKAADLVDNQWRETLLYDKYKEYYGYVFYIGRKM